MPAAHIHPAPASASRDKRDGMAIHYVHLLIMTVLSFAAMYVLMYAMANSLDNVFANVNQFYMAGRCIRAAEPTPPSWSQASRRSPRSGA